MSKLRRLLAFTALILSSALVEACVAAPNDVATLDAEHPLSQHSDHGLVEASVSLDGAEISRGPNDFSITLSAAQDAGAPTLVRMDASMAAHGHSASAANIIQDGQTYRALGLDLFMSGRWQVELGVDLDASSDLVEFALDVP